MRQQMLRHRKRPQLVKAVVYAVEDTVVTKELSAMAMLGAPTIEASQSTMASAQIVIPSILVKTEHGVLTMHAVDEVVVDLVTMIDIAEPLEAIPRSKPLMAGVAPKVELSSMMNKLVKPLQKLTKRKP